MVLPVAGHVVLDLLTADPLEANDHVGTGLFRYGIPRHLGLDLMLNAEWSGEETNVLVGRLAIKSLGAASMNAFFSSFDLAGDAEVVVRDGTGHGISNTYTATAANWADGELQTALVPGDELIIEFHGTAEERDASTLQLESVIHGLIDFFNNDSRSNPAGYECLIDAACDQGDGWRDQIRSVVMFTREDGEGCSGVLLNNTSGDRTPYVYAAHHCRATFNPGSWVFYFNYQRPSCESGTASLSQPVHGAQVVASNYGGDFDLLLLNQTPPASYNAYYAGWDRSANTPSDGVFVGHPFIGPKKITTWSGASTSSAWGFDKPTWRVNIEQGGLAGGNSGSPFFNAEKRVVGIAMSGAVGCSGGERWAQAPKMSANWEGPEPSGRLKDWLDPAGTGALTLNGTNGGNQPNGPNNGSVLRVKVKMLLQGAYEPSEGRMRAQLNVPTTEPYSQLGYAHTLTGGGETTSAGVLYASGNAQIVDWVVVELRQASHPYNVVASRAGLLRRDGRIVETDGSLDGLVFQGLTGNSFRVAVRHRNHLGIMTGQAYDLSSGNLIDLASAGTALFGTQAAVTIGSVRCLWMGDADMNGEVKYTGSTNDRDPILERLDGNAINAVAGYFQEDTNLDGEVKYTGLGNDRDALWNVMGGNALQKREAQLP